MNNTLNNYPEGKEKEISDRQKWDNVTSSLIEKLPSELPCPKCREGTMELIITKRNGFHWQCRNNKCEYDTAQIHDFSSRDKMVYACAKVLKAAFPKLNFVENIGYSPESIITGEVAKRSPRYDYSVYYLGMKISRIRVEVNKEMDKKRFFESNYCYVLGNSRTVDYLSKKKNNVLLVHFLPDSNDKQSLAMTKISDIVKLNKMDKDNFGNIQYTIPKDFRPVITTFDLSEMEDLMFQGFHRIIHKNLRVY